MNAFRLRPFSNLVRARVQSSAGSSELLLFGIDSISPARPRLDFASRTLGQLNSTRVFRATATGASPSLGNRTITTVIAPTGFQRIRGVSIASEGRRVESSRVERNAWERIESNF